MTLSILSERIRAIQAKFPDMRNLSMAAELAKGEAKDVSPYRKVEGLYQLPDGFFEEGMEYVDAERGLRVWSIGRSKITGFTFASTNTRFYGVSDEFECMWLR